MFGVAFKTTLNINTNFAERKLPVIYLHYIKYLRECRMCLSRRHCLHLLAQIVYMLSVEPLFILHNTRFTLPKSCRQPKSFQ
jgi:hypothetical protein